MLDQLIKWYFHFFFTVWLVFGFHGMLCVLFSWNGQGHHTRTDRHHVSHDRHFCHFPDWGRRHICYCSLSHHWLCTTLTRPSELRYHFKTIHVKKNRFFSHVLVEKRLCCFKCKEKILLFNKKFHNVILMCLFVSAIEKMFSINI